MTRFDEKTLVRRAVSGDVKAFNELLKETGGKLFSENPPKSAKAKFNADEWEK